jgi:hypothetical protein
MKKDTLGTFLLAALVMTSAGAAASCYWFLKASAQLKELSLRVNRVNAHRAMAQAMAVDLNAYARSNPSIRPVLERSGLNLGTNIVVAP